jgi:hypothetical protein
MNTEQELTELRNTLAPYLPVLGKTADAVMDQDVSAYPIFVLYHEEDVSLGLPVVADGAGGWSVNISTLEELVVKQVVNMDGAERLRAIFPSPERKLSLLVWSAGQGRFVFLPRYLAK